MLGLDTVTSSGELKDPQAGAMRGTLLRLGSCYPSSGWFPVESSQKTESQLERCRCFDIGHRCPMCVCVCGTWNFLASHLRVGDKASLAPWVEPTLRETTCLLLPSLRDPIPREDVELKLQKCQPMLDVGFPTCTF